VHDKLWKVENEARSAEVDRRPPCFSWPVLSVSLVVRSLVVTRRARHAAAASERLLPWST